MNYGLTQMSKGAYPEALSSFQSALLYTPNYPSLEINLGIVLGALKNPIEAEQHFQRAILLAPANDETHFYYGRWLFESGRVPEAIAQCGTAVLLNPQRLSAHDLLATALLAQGDVAGARVAAEESLRIDGSDDKAKAILARPTLQTADDWINASLYRYRSQDYAGCIAAARQALQRKPDSAIAYNNIAAAYAAMRQWGPAVEAARQALRLQPDFQLAKNNLAWALSQETPHAPN
jgi:tetratricopeptide (TPR) repeat protein